jgi:hypothetical protein
MPAFLLVLKLSNYVKCGHSYISWLRIQEQIPQSMG